MMLGYLEFENYVNNIIQLFPSIANVTGSLYLSIVFWIAFALLIQLAT